jgi:membrane protein required for colicin V production
LREKVGRESGSDEGSTPLSGQAARRPSALTEKPLIRRFRRHLLPQGEKEIMTTFDYIVGAILLISGLIGWVRGATREVTTVIAFIVAAVVAVFGVRFTGPIAEHFIKTVWLAHVAAILGLFVIVYIVLRMIGGALTRGVKMTPLSGIDRLLGLGLGLVRGLVVVGVFFLVMTAATPGSRMPAWITKAKSYPIASLAGHALRQFAPHGFAKAKEAAPALEHAVLDPDPQPSNDQPSPPPETKRRVHGYSEDQRKALDDLVEKSR